MEWWLLGLILFGLMLVLMSLGINVAFSLGVATIVGILLVFPKPSAGFVIVAHEAYNRGASYLMLAIPMFVLLSEFIIAADIGKETFDVVSRFLCRLPGSLGVAVTVLSTGFAALIGSSLANAVIIGRVSIPEMNRYGYAKSLAAGVVCAGGTLGILIPPSIPLVFYALFSEESLSKLFMAGIVPGIMISGLMSAYIITRAKLDPAIAPPLPHVRFVEAVRKSYKLLPFFILLVSMIAAFYLGIATPTEIGGLSAFVALVLVFAYRRFDRAKMKEAVLNCIRTTVMLMWILIPALAFSTVLAFSKFPQNVTEFVISLPVSPWVIMVAINVFLLLVGCILETGAIVMIIWPMLIIVAEALGWNLIWFAVILVIQMELGQITPPVAIVLFAMKSIAPDIEVKDIYRGVLPFVAILAVSIVMIILFPQVALWLPSLMG